MFPFCSHLFRINGPRENNLRSWFQLQRLFNLSRLGEKYQLVSILRSEAAADRVSLWNGRTGGGRRSGAAG